MRAALVLPLLTLACTRQVFVPEPIPNPYPCPAEQQFAEADTPLFGGPSWADLTATLPTTTDLVVDTTTREGLAERIGTPLVVGGRLDLDWAAVTDLGAYRPITEAEGCTGITAMAVVPATLTSPDLGATASTMLSVLLPTATGAPREFIAGFRFDPADVDPTWLDTHVPVAAHDPLTAVYVGVELRDDGPLQGTVSAMELNHAWLSAEGTFSTDPVAWPTP